MTPEKIVLGGFVLKVLKCVGVGISKPLKWKSIFLQFLSITACFWITTEFIVHIARYTMVTDNFQYAEISSSSTFLASTVIMFILFPDFFYNQFKLLQLLEDFGDFTEFEKPENIEQHDELLSKIFKCVIIFGSSLGPVMLGKAYMEDCREVDLVHDFACGLVVRGYWPGLNSPRGRTVLTTIETTIGYLTCFMIFTCVWFYNQFPEFLVIYLKHNQKLIGQIALCKTYEERHEKLKYAVKYHQRIIELYERFFVLVRTGFSVHSILTPITVAFFVYLFNFDFNLVYLPYLSILITFTLIACIGGQRLTNESLEIFDVAYQTIPFDDDFETSKGLLLIMMRSLRPLRVPSGYLTDCNHPLFASILKTAYSYMALLIHFSDGD